MRFAPGIECVVQDQAMPQRLMVFCKTLQQSQ